MTDEVDPVAVSAPGVFGRHRPLLRIREGETGDWDGVVEVGGLRPGVHGGEVLVRRGAGAVATHVRVQGERAAAPAGQPLVVGAGAIVGGTPAGRGDAAKDGSRSSSNVVVPQG